MIILVLLFVVELLSLFFLSRLLTRALSSLFFRISKSQNVTIQLISFLFLPGVIIHELAHLLTAAVLFVPVGEVEFLPQIIEGGVKLGSVSIGKTDPFRRAIIGFAPVIVGLAIIISAFVILACPGSASGVAPILIGTPQNDGCQNSIWKIIILFYILFEVGNTMFSSKKDVEGTVELLVVVGFFAAVVYIAGFRVDVSFFQKIVSPELISFFKKADMFFLLPIAIDVGIVGITKLLQGKR